MAYTLENLAADCNQALKDDSGSAGRDKMARHLETALKDREFVAAQFPPENEVERQVIYEDPDFGFCILAHVYQGAKASNPHDHADSWAIYGQADGVTEMTDWRKVKDASGDEPGVVEAEKGLQSRAGHGAVLRYWCAAFSAPRGNDTPDPYGG